MSLYILFVGAHLRPLSMRASRVDSIAPSLQFLSAVPGVGADPRLDRVRGQPVRFVDASHLTAENTLPIFSQRVAAENGRLPRVQAKTMRS